MKLVYKRLKSVVIGTALVGILAGCSKEVKEEKTTQATIESTTEMPTEEVVTEATASDVTKEDIEYNYELDAINLFNDYTPFFSEYANALSKRRGAEITPNDMKNEIIEMLKVINGDVSDSEITSSRVEDQKELINNILFPQELAENLQLVDNVNFYANHPEYGVTATIEGSLAMNDIPTLSQFALTDETKNKLETYETLRNMVVNDLATTKTVSDETKQALTNATSELVRSYRKEENSKNTNPIYESDKLLNNLADESLVELTGIVVGPYIYVEGIGDVQLIAATDEEKDMLNRYNLVVSGLSEEQLSKEFVEEVLDLKARLEVTKYEEGVCLHLENLGRHADDNVDTYGKIDLLKLKKQAMLALYENKQGDYEAAKLFL